MPSSKVTFSSIQFDPVDKSPEDQNDYYHYTLPNGLSVMVAQLPYGKRDSKSPAPSEPLPPKNAGVAVAVKVGHMVDPDAFPGLAHFLEHMLFMGNSKYPGENDWEEYISNHGGYSNASTDCEHTIYQYEILPDKLKSSLDMFAQFFISPIFAPDATKREVRAVDSEFKEAFQNDSLRLADVLAETVSQDHPASKFGWGNLETLETKPQEQGLNTRDALLAFHEKYYSSHAMKACVVIDSTCSREYVEDLIVYLYELFSQVPCLTTNPADVDKYLTHKQAQLSDETNVNTLPMSSNMDLDAVPLSTHVSPADRPPLLNHSPFGPPIQDYCANELFRVVPTRDEDQLMLSWSFEPILHLYKSKPADLLEFIIGHEAKGSLSWVLKEEGLATGLLAGCGNDESSRNTAFSLFTITITLTKKGLKQYTRTISLCHQFLRLFAQKTNQELLPYWEELQQVNSLSFRYAQSQDPLDYAESLVSQMQVYAVKDILTGPLLIDSFDFDAARRILNAMNPYSVRYDLSSRDIEEKMKLLPSYSQPLSSFTPVVEVESSLGGALSHTTAALPLQCSAETILSQYASKHEEGRYSGLVVQQTHHFQVKYTRQSLPKAFADTLMTVPIHPQLALPPPNPFLPTDFTIRQPSEEDLANTPGTARAVLESVYPDAVTLRSDIPVLVRGIPVCYQSYSDGNYVFQDNLVKDVPISRVRRDSIGGFAATTTSATSNTSISTTAAINNTNSNTAIRSASTANTTLTSDLSYASYGASAALSSCSPHAIHYNLLKHPQHQPCPHGELWHLLDTKFCLPRTSYSVLLCTPLAYTSPLSVVLSRLLVNVISDTLEESTYPASLVETNYEIDSFKMGLEFKFTGFSCKMSRLALHVLSIFKQLLVDYHEELTRFLKIQEISPEILSCPEKCGSIITPTSISQYASQFPTLCRFFDLRTKSIRAIKHLCYESGDMSSFMRWWVLQQQRYSVYDLVQAAVGDGIVGAGNVAEDEGEAVSMDVSNTDNEVDGVEDEDDDEDEDNEEDEDEDDEKNHSQTSTSADSNSNKLPAEEGSHITPFVFFHFLHTMVSTRFYTQVLVHGNTSVSEATEFYDTLQGIMKETSETSQQIPGFPDFLGSGVAALSGKPYIPWSSRVYPPTEAQAEIINDAKAKYASQLAEEEEKYAKNTNSNTATAQTDELPTLMDHMHISPYRRYREHIARLPANTTTTVIGPVRNSKEKATSVSVYFQAGKYTPRLGAAMSLLHSIMYEPCFDQLRTKEQLGYSVYVEDVVYDSIHGIAVDVTSSSHQHHEILTSIDNFLRTYRNKLSRMSLETFTARKEAFIAQLSSSDSNLGDVTYRLWNEIRDGSYVFDRRYRHYTTLPQINKANIIGLYDTVILGLGADKIPNPEFPMEKSEARNTYYTVLDSEEAKLYHDNDCLVTPVCVSYGEKYTDNNEIMIPTATACASLNSGIRKLIVCALGCNDTLHAELVAIEGKKGCSMSHLDDDNDGEDEDEDEDEDDEDDDGENDYEKEKVKNVDKNVKEKEDVMDDEIKEPQPKKRRISNMGDEDEDEDEEEDGDEDEDEEEEPNGEKISEKSIISRIGNSIMNDDIDDATLDVDYEEVDKAKSSVVEINVTVFDFNTVEMMKQQYSYYD